MRLVPSPTSRSMLAQLVTVMIPSLVVALTASLVLSSPARAANPPAPGSFTGYGFDACAAPSQATMDIWNLQSPFSAIGIYVSGGSRYCGDTYQTNLTKTWVAKNAANGWRYLPIHVGRQAPCFKNNPKSRVQKAKMSSTPSTARTQGAADATEALAALKKYGFPSGSIVYLDLEYWARTAACDKAVLAFADAWTETLHGAGHLSGVYSSGSAAIALIDKARTARTAGFTLPDQMWNAWGNKKADTRGGPYLADAGWVRQRLHQYENGVSVTYGGITINLDRDFLDVGKGSVATRESLPCGVKMSFTSYPRLNPGDKGAAVSALQCLLKQRGLKKTVTGTFGAGTASGINAFRKSLGWGPSTHTTAPTWTALLAAGSKPHVLKEGSVGEPVWRLQRALVAAGLPVRITGLYDAKTVAAVQRFRSSQGGYPYVTTESTVWGLLQRGRTSS